MRDADAAYKEIHHDRITPRPRPDRTDESRFAFSLLAKHAAPLRGLRVSPPPPRPRPHARPPHPHP
eukprot:64945-Prymnesium_polylepis.1